MGLDRFCFWRASKEDTYPIPNESISDELLFLGHAMDSFYLKETDGLPTDIHWKGIKRTLEAVIFLLRKNVEWNKDIYSKAFLDTILDYVKILDPVRLVSPTITVKGDYEPKVNETDMMSWNLSSSSVEESMTVESAIW